jgi:hypothetical protein
MESVIETVVITALLVGGIFLYMYLDAVYNKDE